MIVFGIVPDEKWLWRYYAMAQMVAGWSKDPSTKVGAVVVGQDPRHISFGYNGFPPGVADTAERLKDRETKYKFIQHAERNVLDNATFTLQGATLVTTMFPCHDCAKSIVSKGISVVVSPPPLDREPWLSSSAVTRAIFKEVGIKLIEIGADCHMRST